MAYTRRRRSRFTVKNLSEIDPLVTGVYYMTRTSPDQEKDRIHLFFVVAPQPLARHPVSYVN